LLISFICLINYSLIFFQSISTLQITTQDILQSSSTTEEVVVTLPGCTKFQNPSVFINDRLKNAGSGVTAVDLYDHFTIGFFNIDCTLITPHVYQRPISQDFVTRLARTWNAGILQRRSNPGILIGSGEGWNNLYNRNPEPIHITPDFPHLNSLRIAGQTTIGSIVCGQHRAIAIQEYAKLQDNPKERYWTFRVLSPGKIFIFRNIL
jgi:hypothetical protein